MGRNFLDRIPLCEKDIEDYLFDNPGEVSFFTNDGTNLRIARWVGRQISVPSGIADLLGVTEEGAAVVVEVKLGAIDGKAIAQCARYARDLGIVFERIRGIANGNFDMPVLKLVIGASIDKWSMFECYATDTCWIEFSPMLTMSFSRTRFTSEFHQSVRDQYSALAGNLDLFAAYDEWEFYCDQVAKEKQEIDSTAEVLE